MQFGGPAFALAIIAMSMLAWIITTAIRAKHGYPLEDEWGGKTVHPRDPNGDAIKALKAENEQLKATVDRLEERLPRFGGNREHLIRVREGPHRLAAGDVVDDHAPEYGHELRRAPALARQLVRALHLRVRLRVVEAAREVGGRELVKIPFTWPAKAPQSGKAHGNVVDHEYEIERDGHTVATISKKWFRVRESYGVDVTADEDVAHEVLGGHLAHRLREADNVHVVEAEERPQEPPLIGHGEERGRALGRDDLQGMGVERD